MTFFANQDWVWGVALMISGLFVAILATIYGQEKFRNKLVNVPGNDFNLGKVYSWILKYLVPAEFMAMFGWWMYQAATVDGWWDPTNALSVGTCLLQWGMALSVLIYFNKQIATASLRGEADEA